ncbi:MAG: pilY1 [Noviherbaspirillum sp.]|nr:pilY1 [Noviherbaspirillum sp.]
MKHVSLRARFGSCTSFILLASLSVAMLWPARAAHAGITDISQTPMASSSSTVVKPNLMFVFDDSLSMSWSHLPDTVADFGVGSAKYGYRSAHCNGVYYNPNVTYVPPPTGTSAGGDYGNSDFTKAWKNGFNQSAGTVDLRTKFYAYGDGEDGTDNTITVAQAANGNYMQGHDTLQAAYYYVYSGTQTSADQKNYNDPASIFYKECNSVIGSTTKVDGVNNVNTLFTKVVVSATSGPGNKDERQNFANWFSYYRTRMLMMKSAVGRAYKNIDDRYRVGFSTINYAGVDSTDDRFLKIADFGTVQKENFYKKLYKTTFALTGTPLRPALSKAGRMYAGKLLTGADDPVQYSCQQNFTLLSTDGYWNTPGETSTYGPFKIDGRERVGNQDGSLEKPYYDGSKVTVTTKTRYTTVERKQTVTPKTTTKPWLRNVKTVSAASCAIPATGPVQDGDNKTWSMYSSNPTSGAGNCAKPGGSNAFACRMNPNGGVVGTACRTDSNNQQWCVYSSDVGSSCTALGSQGGAYVCKPATGKTVTTQPQIYNEIIKTNTTVVDDTTTRTDRTVVTVNGSVTQDTSVPNVGQPATVSSSTATESDTGVPGASTVWANNGAGTSACLANPGTSGTTAAAAQATTTVNGTPVVTTLSTNGPTAGTPTVTEDRYTPSDTLADIAAYYYNNDLRTNCPADRPDVCENNVKGGGNDNAIYQHMTTFTLGLGINGKLKFNEGYLQGGSTDYEAIKQGTINWPDPTVDEGPERVDDLWHAAVNGHGTYFSAQTPDSLVSGLTKALAGLSVRLGAGAAAATSNLEPVKTDNLLFLALYRTVVWDGDLKLKTIDPNTGEISKDVKWSAQEKLDTQVGLTTDTRNIYVFDKSATNKLKNFVWGNLNESETAYFTNICGTSLLSQCVDTALGPNLTQTQKDMISGQNLVNFVRGQTGFEDQEGNANRIYRDREHVLGDIVGSQPVYMKSPTFAYADPGYADFKTLHKDRAPMVYAAANDGMLHAFDATMDEAGSGKEKWAYIPPMVMPNLYRLADRNYATKHQYYVDGAPTVGDICPRSPAAACEGSEWKTILVGGLNAGGKGYYALDITDPAHPKALWNFTSADDPDLGLSFGNPVITKRKDGTWVVAVTSGYNNTNGDGKGHLYLLNAYTGALILKLDTSAGDKSTPSGLAKINAWVDSTTDNTAKRFYGGDLLGNVWRFDTDDRIAPAGNEALLLAELGNVSPAANQPITVKPELSVHTVNGVEYAVISVATGRYLGSSDLLDVSKQSIYSLKDTLTETGLGKVRTPGVLVDQAFSTNADGTIRTTTQKTVDWSRTAGWYIDLSPNNESPGERVNVDMQQQLGLLVVAGNVPNNNACNVGGNSWMYSLDFRTGTFLQGATGNKAGQKLPANALIAGLKMLRLNTGKTITIVTTSSGDAEILPNPSGPGTGSGTRRVSWRELVD